MTSKVVSNTNNRSNADLFGHRSQDFLKELGEKCTKPFFERFKMFLQRTVEADLDSDFSCKWAIIETAMYAAMSTEQNTQRLANYYDNDSKHYHSLPMELLINKVEVEVDSYLGKTDTNSTDSKNRILSNYTRKIIRKYDIIFNIARGLGADFKIMRDVITKECTAMHDNMKEYIDIEDFQKKLVIAFEAKGVISQFRTENIPAPQKSLAI